MADELGPQAWAPANPSEIARIDELLLAAAREEIATTNSGYEPPTYPPAAWGAEPDVTGWNAHIQTPWADHEPLPDHDEPKGGNDVS